ncbi:TlpA disulfide reductase family protein [Flavihumibacter petaseus]|uniref:Putative thiol-disulfide oxidoreductase n=1 Tax=Flavihumibacter petaseus NBRC 106054 TaxID=1220578 RepID=A0A0E9N0G8_9BACT|nr:TlpA disulfide reductase family protein [Flavihumibacter petaseus]GAO43487.1 putative thiol-disulfide oxidoreductase [Flavihumibacter petaseus NBRC 106054]
MKRLFPLLPLLLLAFLQKSIAQDIQITGKVTGVADKSQVYLTDPDKPGDTLATATSKQENFVLKAQLPATKLYQVSFMPAGKKGLLFLEPGKIQVTGNLDKIQDLEVKGSTAQAGFKAFQATFDPYFKRYSQLTQLANQSGVNDSLMTQYKQLVAEIGDAAEKFAGEHASEPIAPFMWATLLQVVEDPVRIEKSLNAFSAPVKESFYGKYLSDKVAEMKIGRVGTPALDFTQADTSGNQVTLSSFRGRYVLVDFWASWCGPCRQENPNLLAAYKKFKEKNFTVLGVSLDNNKDRWLKAIADDRLQWTQVSDLKYWQNEVALQYKIQSIPQNLLIDPNGVIVAKNLRGDALEQKLCELLGCN